jgi:SAM-dependent methyltransferase
MVDSIPENFWQNKNIKVLDSCCGNGNFHGFIQTKTSLDNLYFNEINTKRVANVKRYFGDDINITQKDFLSFDSDDGLFEKNKIKYDLIVSNPPYAKFNGENRTSKNHNMSRDFIKKAIELTKKDGCILFIVLNNWMSYSDRNTLPQLLSLYQFHILDIGGAKKYFPKVGSSFTWFLLQKSPNKYEFIVKNHYKIQDIQKTKLKPNSKFIPLYLSNTVSSILDKTIYDETLPRYKVQTTSYLHRTTKKHLISDIKTDIFKYRLIHTPSTTVYSKQKHKFQDGYKVFMSLTNQYGTFVDDCGMTQSVAFVMCENEKQAYKIKIELDSEVYRFINNITRYGNFNNVRVLQSFPVLGSFKLNEKETKFVKKFNKLYYENKPASYTQT